jgi:hypothetical protein
MDWQKLQNSEVVLFNEGKSWYIPHVLTQAKIANNGQSPTLLCDVPRAMYNHATQVPIRAYHKAHQEIAHFHRIYQHMSPNDFYYERRCWERWFYLFNYMATQKIHAIIYLDSDALLYANPEDFFKTYADQTRECGFPITIENPTVQELAASAHISYWTQEALGKFCEFIHQTFSQKHYLDIYKEKWALHQTKACADGVSDMTTLHLFWEKYKTSIHNLAPIQNNCIVDNNVSQSFNYTGQTYMMEKKIKKIGWQHNKPYFSRIEDGSRISPLAIHFQGTAKKHIPTYIQAPLLEKIKLSRHRARHIWTRICYRLTPTIFPILGPKKTPPPTQK